MNRLTRWALIAALGAGSTACSTNIFRKQSRSRPQAIRASTSSMAPASGRQSSIVALDNNTFRFQYQEFKDVWNTTLDILLENYNLNIVDRRSGIITTEWDSFYIGDTVFRNKLSIRLKKVAFNMVDVTIHNGVEALKTIDRSGLATAWLPTEGGGEEMERILQNIAISMNLPKPILSKEKIARQPRSNQRQQ